MPVNDIIVIGASAGGVEVLKQLVHDLPRALPASVFIVLHTGAHPSVLPAILRRAGPLPVDHPVDGSPIEQGRIYVAPPDHHLIVVPGHVQVTRGPKENNARPSINTLFRTAANAYGSRVAGVVLTGNLNDGTVGLWEVKRNGGVSIVQTPSEADFPSMPLSAAENVQIDYNVSVSQMGSLLWLLANERVEPETETGPKTLLERRMELKANSGPDAQNFSELTCPECRGPLWHEPYGKLEQFKCRVGHAYSFEHLLEEHATTRERTLWMAVLAMEESALLARQAAKRAFDAETRQTHQRNAQKQERHAISIREMLTQPDDFFSQQESEP